MADKKTPQNKKSRQLPYSQIDELVEQIYIKLLEGESRYRIKLMLERNNFVTQDGEVIDTAKHTPNQHLNYIARAYDQCKYELAENRDRQRDVLYERLLSVYNDAYTNSDRGNALKALDQISRLAGLNSPELVNATITDNVIISFGLEDEKQNDNEEEEDNIN